MKIEREEGGIIAWHGTDRTDFASVDISHAAPYNVGLPFGTRAAALNGIDSFLNPFRICVGVIVSIATECGRDCLNRVKMRPLLADAFETNASTGMPRNSRSIRLSQSLGYDGLVYANELEDGKSAADSDVVFDIVVANEWLRKGENLPAPRSPDRVNATVGRLNATNRSDLHLLRPKEAL